MKNKIIEKNKMIPITIISVLTNETIRFTENEIERFCFYESDLDISVNFISKQKSQALYSWYLNQEKIIVSFDGIKKECILVGYAADTKQYFVAGPAILTLELKLKLTE